MGRGLSFGALGALGAAVAIALLELQGLPADFAELEAAAGFRFWWQSVALLAVVLLPLGGILGAGLGALVGERGAIVRRLRALANEPLRDRRVASWMVGAVVAAGVWVLAMGFNHASFLHELNNKAMAAAFAMVLAGVGLGLGLLLGGIAQGLALRAFRRLKLERLDPLYHSKSGAVLWLALGGIVVFAVLVMARFYDPSVWPARYLLLLTIPIAFPLVFWWTARRFAWAGGWWWAPLLWCLSLAAAGFPIFTMEAEDPVRIAMLQGTQLERRVLAFYSSLGDRDGDGYASILGGPDCDDRDPNINPTAFDIPGNGIDENCVGGDARQVEHKRNDFSGRSLRLAEEAMLRSATAGAGAPEIMKLKPRVDLKGKNVVFILADTVRHDHVGFAGYERDTTPRWDEIAAQSVVYTHAYSQAPNTPRSIPAIFTGRYPSEIKWRKRYRNFSPIRDEVLTLFEILEAEGYRNHSLTSHWYFREKRKLDAGFALWDNAGSVDIAPSNTDISAPRIYARLAGHLDTLQNQEQPWTLWIHLVDPHGRYMKHKGEVPDWGSGLMDKYDQEIRFTDGYIGKIWDDLASRGLLEDTAVVIVADHGEAFGEHGHHFHGQTLYEEITRVPLTIYIPGVAATQVTTPVELVDIAPTLLDAMGIVIPAEISGRSLVPSIVEPNTFAAKAVYSEHLACPSWDKEQRALVDGPWKLIWRVTEGTWELYNLDEDPGEKRNLYRKNREQAKRMRAKMVDFVEAQLRRP